MLPFEALDEGILLRTTLLDERSLDALLGEPVAPRRR
jgi:hypothetical protein